MSDVVAPQADVVYSVPTLYRSYENVAAGELPRHVRPVDRVANLAAERGARRFVYLSSTAVYGDHGGEWVDEESDCHPTSPYGRMRHDIETHLVKGSGSMAVDVARLGGIYGPGRTMIDYIESGRYKLVDGGVKPTNRIHVDDIVRALMALCDRPANGGGVVNIVDGHPTTVAELVDWLVERCEIERPAEISLEAYAKERGPNAVARWRDTYRVDNTRLREELGVQLEFPSVFDGYAAILGS